MWGLSITLVLIYGAANVILNIPTFLRMENLLYMLLYPFFTYLHTSRSISGPLIALAFFNAGRISRTLITPEGQLHEVAFSHVPVFALAILIGFMAMLKKL